MRRKSRVFTLLRTKHRCSAMPRGGFVPKLLMKTTEFACTTETRNQNFPGRGGADAPRKSHLNGAFCPPSSTVESVGEINRKNQTHRLSPTHRKTGQERAGCPCILSKAAGLGARERVRRLYVHHVACFCGLHGGARNPPS